MNMLFLHLHLLLVSRMSKYKIRFPMHQLCKQLLSIQLPSMSHHWRQVIFNQNKISLSINRFRKFYIMNVYQSILEYLNKKTNTDKTGSPCEDQYSQYCSTISNWCPSVCDDKCWPASPATTPATTTQNPGKDQNYLFLRSLSGLQYFIVKQVSHII